MHNTWTIIYQNTKPNAAAMLSRITSHPCPIGILKTADSLWKTNKTRKFYGYSYTSPTPSIYTTQQLGLGITKAFATHIKNAAKALHAPAPYNRRESDSITAAPILDIG
jgi:hypothetical protein